ncbi:cdap-2 [Pristionchus pacificus]|uniref:SH3 domain-containing protein n=1 Tax=Pristionchus pacificus TaxID=54126 RepID=A0A2A6CBT5_PRIPA|nr:cdap-2 [Pristionchus pacificus]|eukprot:PDM75672.1 SH3 domain-containing protein [Pristionchus pacificus]
MATTVQSEVPMAGSVAKMVNRLSKVEDPILKLAEPKKQLHIVVYEYKAQQIDELDLEVNDIIEIMKPVEDGWNRGKNERTGQSGMYPTNYCEVYRPKGGLGLSGVNKQYVTLKKSDGSAAPIGEVPNTLKRISGMEMMKGKEDNSLPSLSSLSSINSLPSISASPPNISKEEPEKEFARVTFDYEAQHEDELSLKVGETVWVVKKRTTDCGWYEGEVDGRRGLFPDNFVTLIKSSSGMGTSSNSNGPSTQPPLNPSSNMSSLSNIPCGRVGDRPPASLPGAISVMPLPPQVPAKPGKSMGGPSNGVTTTTTTCIGSVTPGWKMTMSGSGINPSLTPSTVSTTSTLPLTSSVPSNTVKEGEKEVIKPPFSSFKDKQANLLASLNISSLNPSAPRPNCSSHSKSTTKIDQEGVTSDNGEVIDKETPLLSHPTKNRPKIPCGVRRPVSMFPTQTSEFNAISKEVMTRSEMTINDHPAPVGSSMSLSPTALSVSPSLSSREKEKEKETPSSIVSSSRSSTGTPTPILSSSHTTLPDSLDSNQSQWVSRSEYNQLLTKVSLLEERLAILEHR